MAATSVVGVLREKTPIHIHRLGVQLSICRLGVEKIWRGPFSTIYLSKFGLGWGSPVGTQPFELTQGPEIPRPEASFNNGTGYSLCWSSQWSHESRQVRQWLLQQLDKSLMGYFIRRHQADSPKSCDQLSPVKAEKLDNRGPLTWHNKHTSPPRKILLLPNKRFPYRHKYPESNQISLIKPQVFRK